jgi:hypothetical protein
MERSYTMENKMIRDIMLSASELLFYLLDGEMLINTFWVFVYVLVLSFFLLSPVMAFERLGRFQKWAPMIFIITFFPGLFLSVGPPIVQGQMMQECRVFEQSITGELAEARVISFKECRYKDNYYGDFGEWKVQGIKQ